MDKEPHQVGHLIFLDSRDPSFEDRSAAEQYALAHCEEEPLGIWTPGGELLTIAYQSELYHK